MTRFGVTSDFTAEEIVAVRFTFAGIILLPYYFYKQVWKRILPFKSIVIASGAGAIYVYVSALGLTYVPAGHLGIVEAGTMLILSALGGYIFLNEKKSTTQILGYALIIGGLVMISWQNFTFAVSAEYLYGDLLLIIGGILWASYTVLVKKWRLMSWIRLQRCPSNHS